MLTKRTPGVAGVVGSGERQHPRVLPRPNVSGQAHAFSFWSSSPMSKMASSAKRSLSVNEHDYGDNSPRTPADGRGRVTSRAPVRKRRVG